MAFKFNSDSINSINYNGTEILNLWHNGSSIWAKRYDDVKLLYPTSVGLNGVGDWSNVSSGYWQRHSISRKSSLEPNPSELTYDDDGHLVVHYGDVLKADGSIVDVSTGKMAVFPSGDYLKVGTSKELKLSGSLLLPKTETYMPKLTFETSAAYKAKVYLTHFDSFGLSDYLCMWNNSPHNAEDYCRCWVSLLKATTAYDSSTKKYNITRLSLPTSLTGGGHSGYDSNLGGWVFSPSDYFSNTPGFSLSNSSTDGVFNARYFERYTDSSSETLLASVILATRNRYTNQYEFIQSFSCSYNPSQGYAKGFGAYWGQSIDSSGTIGKMVDEATSWMYFQK